MTAALFVNEGQFRYSKQINEILVIPITDFSVGSEANRNITVIAMYSNTATGTSKNSTAINIPGIKLFTVTFSLPNNLPNSSLEFSDQCMVG